MYNQQISDRKLKKEKEKLETQKAVLENKTEIKTYLGWRQLPTPEQTRIRKEWDGYYEKAKTTTSFKEYFEMKKYWKEGNMGKVKELADKARVRLEKGNFKLTKPVEVDPWEFSHGIYNKYDAICNKIRWINKQLTGIEDVEEIFSN